MKTDKVSESDYFVT